MTKAIKNYGTIATDPEMLRGPCSPKVVFGVCRGSPWLVSFYIIIYVSYLMFGALVFSTTEAPGEIQLRQRLQELRQAFLIQYPCVQGVQTKTTRARENVIMKMVMLFFFPQMHPWRN